MRSLGFDLNLKNHNRKAEFAFRGLSYPATVQSSGGWFFWARQDSVERKLRAEVKHAKGVILFADVCGNRGPLLQKGNRSPEQAQKFGGFGLGPIIARAAGSGVDAVVGLRGMATAPDQLRASPRCTTRPSGQN